MIQRIVKWLIITVVLAAVVAIAVVRFREPPVREINFATLSLAATANQYLICPRELCTKATSHAQAPTFALRPAQLSQAYQRMLITEPRIRLVRRSDDGLQVTVIQRTPWMAYPDIITARFLPAPAGASVAIYSRSVYGSIDYGVNRKRVEDWLRRLGEIAARGG